MKDKKDLGQIIGKVLSDFASPLTIIIVILVSGWIACENTNPESSIYLLSLIGNMAIIAIAIYIFSFLVVFLTFGILESFDGIGIIGTYIFSVLIPIIVVIVFALKVGRNWYR